MRTHSEVFILVSANARNWDLGVLSTPHYKRENELQDGMAIVSMYMQEMLGPIRRKDGVAVQPTTQ